MKLFKKTQLNIFKLLLILAGIFIIPGMTSCKIFKKNNKSAYNEPNQMQTKYGAPANYYND
ncbi:MAG: hypothetical protein Kow0068_15210 [Marinilabiliales bacterium]